MEGENVDKHSWNKEFQMWFGSLLQQKLPIIFMGDISETSSNDLAMFFSQQGFPWWDWVSFS